MVLASDPITAVSSRIAPAAWAELNIYTVADLLLHFPVHFGAPPPRVRITDLAAGQRVAVVGTVQRNTTELLEVGGYSRRLRVPCSYIADGGKVHLRLEWVEERSDPPDLRPGDRLVVAGFPWVYREGLFKKLMAAGMTDPDFAHVWQDQQHPTAGVDGPDVTYNSTQRVPSYAIAATVRHAVRSLELPPMLPDGNSPDFLRSLIMTAHVPSTQEQANWAHQYRGLLAGWLRGDVIGRPTLPEPRLIKTPRDAEHLAREYMTAFGFEGATVAPLGRDGGVDVRARGGVAQVKLEGVKTDAPKLQALLGIASHEGCAALFFSLAGYTQAAVSWGEQTRMALFEFDYSGGVTACSSEASRLLAEGVPR